MKKIVILIAAVTMITAAMAEDTQTGLKETQTQTQARAQQPQQEELNMDNWANFGRYAQANEAVKAAPTRPDVVFMGNSITDGWASQRREFFSSNNYVGRGIGGQVTAQMLARFRPDVIELAPRAVVILAGTNDIAHNQGFVSVENIAGNIISMAQLAQANGIHPVLCSILPADDYPWRPAVKEVPAKVRGVNEILFKWAEANGATYVDYFTPMADENDGLPIELARDGIHPTAAGYEIMEGIVKPILDRVLR